MKLNLTLLFRTEARVPAAIVGLLFELRRGLLIVSAMKDLFLARLTVKGEAEGTGLLFGDVLHVDQDVLTGTGWLVHHEYI